MLRPLLLTALSVSSSRAFSPASNATQPLNLYCDACTEVATQLESQGCGLACSVIPTPGNLICSWILSMTDLCQEIISKLTGGETPQQACTDIGLCGSACECGVCTQDGAGPNGRCLGFPNDCGHAASSLPAWARDAQAHPNFCVDGQCDGTQSSYGCCLTCF